jgi:hypothetical protein
MRPKQYSFMIAVRDEIHVRPGPRTAGLRWVLGGRGMNAHHGDTEARRFIKDQARYSTLGFRQATLNKTSFKTS